MNEETKNYIDTRIQVLSLAHEKLICDVMEELKLFRKSIERLDPVVKFFDNMTFANGLLWSVMKFIALLGVVVGVIASLIFWIKK